MYAPLFWPSEVRPQWSPPALELYQYQFWDTACVVPVHLFVIPLMRFVLWSNVTM